MDMKVIDIGGDDWDACFDDPVVKLDSKSDSKSDADSESKKKAAEEKAL